MIAISSPSRSGRSGHKRRGGRGHVRHRAGPIVGTRKSAVAGRSSRNSLVPGSRRASLGTANGKRPRARAQPSVPARGVRSGAGSGESALGSDSRLAEVRDTRACGPLWLGIFSESVTKGVWPLVTGRAGSD